MKAFDRIIRGFLLRNIPDGAHVLDVGCGAGWAARVIIRERPASVVHGADSDERHVHRMNTRRWLLRRSAAVRCYPCAAERLVKYFGRSQYDAAVSVHALHHYADPFVALRNMRGVVRPVRGEASNGVRRGGMVLIAELEPQYGETLDDCPRFSLEKIVWLCEDAGLRVLTADVKHPGVILVAAEKS